MHVGIFADLSVSESLKEYLQIYGFDVTILNQESGLSGQFDRLVVDFRIGNLVATDLLRGNNTPAILITGWTDDETIRMLKESSLPYLIHPFKASELASMLLNYER